MTRTQLKSWLFAGSFFCALAGASIAHAAHPTSSPKTVAPAVKAAPAKIVKPVPLPLQLTPPTFQPVRREKLILGLRLPTFIAFGLSGLSAGGALATRVAASRGNDPSTCGDSRCIDHGVRQKALLVTTGILTGMAAAGVGIGITFMLKAPKDQRRDAIRPRFDLGLSGEKAVAKVGWVFTSL
jgi:hypothetical protein